MAKEKPKNINLRSLILLIFSLILIVIVFYKYFEWQTITELSNAYNDSFFKEIEFVSKMEPSYSDFSTEINTNQHYIKPKDLSDFFVGIEAVKSKSDIVINNEEGYGDLLKQDLIKFNNLKPKVNLLLGERGDLAKAILNDQLSYYKNEMENNNINLASYYADSIFFTIWKDNGILKDFLNNVGSSTDPQTVSKYFSSLVSLDKYSDDSFKFDNEDYINTYFPNLVNKINNWKRFFKAYYSAEKDFSKGNTDTAQLELQAVNNNGFNSIVDYSTMFDEQKQIESDLSKSTLRLVSDQAAAIKKYKKEQFYKYPLLRDINIWKEDFVLCQMYDFKTRIYKNITSNYPTSRTVSNLIKELSSINPKTDNVDGTFDKSVMGFKNSDKQIGFTCEDKYSGKKLNFIIPKVTTN